MMKKRLDYWKRTGIELGFYASRSFRNRGQIARHQEAFSWLNTLDIGAKALEFGGDTTLI